MSQTIQYDKNPAAEGAAVRVSRAAATPTIATDTFTSWPPQGTKSHKLVATATTDAVVGLPNADRPAAAAGQIWSARATIRNSTAGSRTVQLVLRYYDTAGATLGTSLSAVAAGGTFAASEIRVVSINGAIAPVGTASIDLQVQRLAGGGAAAADAVHFDQVTLTNTAAAMAYKDPAFDVFGVWTGTANASTQRYYTPVLTATPVNDDLPAPRMLVFVDDLPPAVNVLTLSRTAENRTENVRGAVLVSVAGGFSRPDFSAPFGIPAAWRAHLFVGTTDVGFTDTVTAQLDSDGCYVHNPIDPTGSIRIDIADTSGRALTRPTDGEVFYPEGRSLGVLVSGRRRGLKGVDMYFSTTSADVAAKFEAMLGGYNDDDQTVPVLCIRTPPWIDIPRTFYAAVLELTKKPVNVHMGGNLREWESSVDEMSPFAPGIVVALLTRDDISAFFSTRNAVQAAYASRTAIDRDYAKAGTA
jgi:hypothetical protein